MKAMTDSLNAVGNSVKEGLALIAQSFLQSSQMLSNATTTHSAPNVR